MSLLRMASWMHCFSALTTQNRCRERRHCTGNSQRSRWAALATSSNWTIAKVYQGSGLRPFFESVRVKIWRGRTCASAWSALLQEKDFTDHVKRGTFSRAWFTHVSHRTQSRGSAEAARMQSGSSARPLCFHSPRQHEREGACSGRSATEDLVFKLVKDRFLNQRGEHVGILAEKTCKSCQQQPV